MAKRIISQLSDFTHNVEYRHVSGNSSHNAFDFFYVKNCDIDFELNLSNAYKSIKFENCTFLKKVICEELDINNNFDFINCEFIETVSFKNIKIAGKSRFWESRFLKKCEFNNVSFKDLADFFKATFYQTMIFYKVDFFGTTVFTETIFKKNVLFTYTKIVDVIIFTRTDFEKGLDLSLAIITGQINIHSSDIKSFDDIPDLYDNNAYRNAVENTGIITRNNKRETFRILKKSSKDADNQFKVLEYSKLENEVYFKQLKDHKVKRFDNFVIFLLNKCSNDHNKSWSRGLLFTGGVGLFFFYCALISTECVESSWSLPSYEVFIFYLGMYFNFLSPLHTMDLFVNEHSSTGTIILDFFGRIFVGYGIYQTIQAFRKHKG